DRIHSWLAQNGFERAPDQLGYHPMSGGVRMNQIGLIEIAMTANSFEEEWDQSRLVLLRELREDALKAIPVVLPEIGWNLHSGEHDFHLRIFRFCFGDNRLEICLQRFQLQAA